VAFIVVSFALFLFVFFFGRRGGRPRFGMGPPVPPSSSDTRDGTFRRTLFAT
jgi:hypothetical protein